MRSFLCAVAYDPPSYRHFNSWKYFERIPAEAYGVVPAIDVSVTSSKVTFLVSGSILAITASADLTPSTLIAKVGDHVYLLVNDLSKENLIVLSHVSFGRADGLRANRNRCVGVRFHPCDGVVAAPPRTSFSNGL